MAAGSRQCFLNTHIPQSPYHIPNVRIADDLGANRIQARFRGRILRRLRKAESARCRVIALLSPVPFPLLGK